MSFKKVPFMLMALTALVAISCKENSGSSNNDSPVSAKPELVEEESEAPVIVPLDSYAKQLGQSFVDFLSGSPTATDSFESVAVTEDGSAWYVGYTAGNLGDTNGGLNDIVAVYLSKDGDILQTFQFGSASESEPYVNSTAGSEKLLGVVILDSGPVLIGQTSGALFESNAGAKDIFAIGINNDGSVRWTKQFGSTTGPSAGLDTSGDQTVGGAVKINANKFAIVGSTTGDFAETSGGGVDAFAVTLDGDGNILEKFQMGSTSRPSGGVTNLDEYIDGACLSSDSRVILTGYTKSDVADTASGWDILAVNLSSSVGLLGAYQLGTTNKPAGGDVSGSDFALSCAGDNSSNVYISGYVESSIGEPVAGSRNIYLLKLDSSFARTGFKQIGTSTTVPGGDTSGDSQVWGMGFNGSEIITCFMSGANIGEANGGYSNHDFQAMSWDINTLEPVKFIQFGSSTKMSPSGDNADWDTPMECALDSQGNIYMAGRTEGDPVDLNAGGADLLAVRIKADFTF